MPGAVFVRISVVVVRSEQPFAELADGEGADGGEGLRVVSVDDEAGDFVGLVGDERLFEKSAQRDFGEGHARESAFLFIFGSDAGERVARAGGCGFGQQRFQVGKGMRAAIGCHRVRHLSRRL